MFKLPELSFEKDGLTPWTSAETINYHHGKHHGGYVKKLNAAVVGSEFAEKGLEDLIAVSRGDNQKIFNLAAQHFNHSFFWNCLSASSGTPEGGLAEAIDRDFGSLDALKEQFSTLALTHFGSGWVWLLKDGDKLALKDFHDADTPADLDVMPLLTLDVWEHAYYIDHRNNRKKFIEGFWEHVNWEVIAEQMG